MRFAGDFNTEGAEAAEKKRRQQVKGTGLPFGAQGKKTRHYTRHYNFRDFR